MLTPFLKASQPLLKYYRLLLAERDLPIALNLLLAWGGGRGRGWWSGHLGRAVPAVQKTAFLEKKLEVRWEKLG